MFADQWRKSSIGISHDDPVITPHMDAFAREGVTCTQAQSACPLCSPARASLISGLYPLHTGVFTNCKNGSDIRLRDEDTCIGDVLKGAGYQTGYIGKWHLDEPELNHDAHPLSGATAWDAYTPPGPRRHGFDFWYAYNACDKHCCPHYWSDSPKPDEVVEWSPIHETDVALSYLEKRDRGKPFALYLSWNPPHSPYDTAPLKYKEQYKDLDYLRGNVDTATLQHVMHHTFEPFPCTEESAKQLTRDYFAAITGLDDQFGRLVAYLKNAGLFDDTIIVLTADHGDMLLSHGLIGKHVWYEESVGIPFVIGGGGLGSGETGTVFSSQDVPVTLAHLLSVPVPATWEGKDIADDILHLHTTQDSYSFMVACPGRDVFIKEFRERGKDITAFGWRAIRDRRYTFVLDVGYRTIPELHYYLYDNDADPLQLKPLVDASAISSVEGKRLCHLLVSWLEAQGDGILTNVRS